MSESIIYYDEIDSPVGTLLIAKYNEKIVRIDFGGWVEKEAMIWKWAKRYFKKPKFVYQPEKLADIKAQLDEYFVNERTVFEFDYAFYGTPFQIAVWEALFTIPFGITKTYKDMAIAVDNPKAVRAIGGAVNKNPLTIVAPCHRVIGTNGNLIGFGGGLDRKEYLLKHEKILLDI